MMSARTRGILLAALLAAAPAQAAGYWAKNYPDAQKIASETGRPMVILFGSSDPRVVQADKKVLENAQLAPFYSIFIFVHIPLIIKDGTMTDALFMKYPPGQGGHQLPMIIFASGAEKMLHKTEGAQTTESLTLSFRIALQKHGPIANPRKAVQAAVAVRRADALFEKQQYGPAARLYQEAIETELSTPPVAVAKDKLAKIEEMAGKQLAAARAELAEKAYPEAVPKLLELERSFAGLKAGQEARDELAKLRELPEAKAALAAGEKKGPSEAPAVAAAPKVVTGPPLDSFTDDDLAALDEMGTPGGAQPAAPDARVSDECRRLFSLAQSWAQNKRPDRARAILNQIIEKYPDSLSAEQANAMLKELK